MWKWMCICGFLVAVGTAPVEAGRPDATAADSLYRVGMGLLEAGQPEEAAQKFRAAIELDGKHAPSYVGMGHAFLRQGDLDAAEDAFMQARRRQHDYAPAYNGLGLVYMRKEKGLQWAIQYFRDATTHDRAYAEAYYNLAEAFRQIEDTKELMAYERLAKVNPDHPDVWFRIGRIYQKGEAGEYVNYEKAAAALWRQLEVNPDHLEARVYLGEALKELDRADEAVEVLEPLVDRPNPYQRQALVELSEVYLKRRDYDRAEGLFDRYIAELGPDTQAVFYDLSLVATGAELERFRSAAQEDRKAISEAFWAGRDPAPVTAANERKLEHFRRVAYALEHFSKFEFPWDARGEIYVRYGEPDHVSSSENIRLETAAKVVAVKERLMRQAGDAVAYLLRIRNSETTGYGAQLGDLGRARALGPMSETLREIGETGGHRIEGTDTRQIPADGGMGPLSGRLLQESSILGWPVYPVFDRVWEYWIYADVGPGIEITFTKTVGRAPFRFADMPSGKGGHTRHLHIWQRMNPSLVLGRVRPRTPVLYRPDFATAPLAFFVDAVGFKGARETSALEVYYGIPTWELAYVTGEDGRPTARVQRGVALFNEADAPVHRSSGEIELYLEGPADTTRRAFVPELDRIAAPPGTYRMSVQLLDRASGKSQVYNQQVRLLPYDGSYLKLSGILLAASIGPASGGKFDKGDIEVVPNPTGAFLPGQSVFIYYEVYSLKKDVFGATRYRVAYEVRSLEQKSVAAKILSGLGRLLGIRQEGSAAISIEYEHVGSAEDDQGYVELDMSNTEPGRQLVKVTVTDQVSGQQTAATRTFEIK